MPHKIWLVFEGIEFKREVYRFCHMSGMSGMTGQTWFGLILCSEAVKHSELVHHISARSTSTANSAISEANSLHLANAWFVTSSQLDRTDSWDELKLMMADDTADSLSALCALSSQEIDLTDNKATEMDSNKWAKAKRWERMRCSTTGNTRPIVLWLSLNMKVMSLRVYCNHCLGDNHCSHYTLIN